MEDCSWKRDKILNQGALQEKWHLSSIQGTSVCGSCGKIVVRDIKFHGFCFSLRCLKSNVKTSGCIMHTGSTIRVREV
jgi:hypothetical protein